MTSDIAINEASIETSEVQNVAGDFRYFTLRKMAYTLFRFFRKFFVSSISEIHQYDLPAGVFLYKWQKFSQSFLFHMSKKVTLYQMIFKGLSI